MAIENGHGHAPGAQSPSEDVIDLKEVTRKAAKDLERKIILKTLEAHGWNRRATARVLSISYAALLYKLREAGIRPRRPRERLQTGTSPIAEVASAPIEKLGREERLAQR